MTGEEYKAARLELGLTQLELSSLKGVSRKTINSRENGGTITTEAELAIRLLLLRATEIVQNWTQANPH